MYCFIALVGLVAASVADPSPLIAGGTEATPYSFPFIGTLEFFGTHICGCSLIAPDYCLTAAHCVDRLDPNQMKVKLGKHSRSEFELGEQDIEVAEIKVHSLYNGVADGFPNDIALLRLSHPANIGGTVQVIKVVPDDASFEGHSVTIAGWGSVSSSTGSVDRLHQASMEKISNRECQVIWGGDHVILDTHICVYDRNQTLAACSNDNGGPVVSEDTNKYLLGVMSWETSACSGHFPSVFTRLSKYIDWINENTR